MLQLENVTKRFGGLVAVSEVSFTAERGHVTSLIGPNGAGKTTLFNMVSGVLEPNSGTVTFQGVDITGQPPHRITSLGMGRTFQNVQLFDELNALENVAAARYCRTRSSVLDATLLTRRYRVERRESFALAAELLNRLGLWEKRLAMPSGLAYGDQRRLEIARALATEPTLIILDEPTAGMIADEARSMMELMRTLIEQGISLLLIEHNINVVMSVSDKVVVLNFGKKIAEGSAAEIRENPHVIEAYLGSDA